MKSINAESETARMTDFLKSVAAKTGVRKVVVGWSGGIDSTLSLYLLRKAYPAKDIFVLHMPYSVSFMDDLLPIRDRLFLAPENIHEINIGNMTDTVWDTLEGNESGNMDAQVRKGNIMARMRMTVLFDFAKKVNALVCGTENRTEHLLGYFTRFGDGASDIEPIQHLYKTQVYELAGHLGIPDAVIKRAPSAGLWNGQTDEGEFGFSYKEADEVLSLYFDTKMTVGEIVKKGYKNAPAIIGFSKKNSFKHEVPYKTG